MGFIRGTSFLYNSLQVYLKLRSPEVATATRLRIATLSTSLSLFLFGFSSLLVEGAY